MTHWIDDIETLERHYGTPGEAARIKVVRALTPAYRAYIERARFCVLTTVGPEGTDGSPRGDDGPAVRIADERTLLMPDWQGNERIDSLRNIVRDGRASLMFLIRGSNNAIRTNGRARLSVDPALLEGFERSGRRPRSVIVFEIAELYSQCARALIRSALWTGPDESEGLPSMGDILREITEGGFDGASYDAAWPARAAKTMW
ncbi:MAG: pyridoxamine 5'-phosphate oxidase family protein [Paracoccus sp. (in: a-proteobacteria)]|nr:pyridoxamine 5'-phosphate oxidase family protein [Paracoccus sp. (in: a-proteobacteria)]